jgi:hypothetical protein
MLQHDLVRPGYKAPTPPTDSYAPDVYAADAVVKLGKDVTPIVIESLQDDNRFVRCRLSVSAENRRTLR